MLAKALCQALYFLRVYLSIPAVTAANWFRFYSESLWGLRGPAQSNQRALPLSYGGSLRLAMPSLRSCSVGPPRSTIHGRARLTRHPCRVAHYAEPALGLPRGRLPPQPPRRPDSRPGSSRGTHSLVGAGLPAMDVNDDVGCLDERVVRKFFVGTPPGASSLPQGPGSLRQTGPYSVPR